MIVEGTIDWRSGEKLPDIPEGATKRYLVSVPAQVNGKVIGITIVAMFTNIKKDTEGAYYIPARKFYWGPDVFEKVIGWAEFPQVPDILLRDANIPTESKFNSKYLWSNE